MERVTRIELAQLAWKARALPLSYTRAPCDVIKNTKLTTNARGFSIFFVENRDCAPHLSLF